jgi:hypothetical protein
MQELESEQPYHTERDNEVLCRVRATITHRDVNLSHSDLRSVPGLQNLSVFHGFQQRTNFPVTPEEGAIPLNLVRRRGRGVRAMPHFNSAFEVLSPGESGILIYTDGLNLTINGDGTGESGWSCICRFDFAQAYGDAAEGLIHVHHLRALSEIGTEYRVDPVADLRSVCPNCHAVLHHRVPAYELDEVRDFLSGRVLRAIDA